jgi:hypothetical protein
VRMGMSSQGGR